ncbi:EpsG family protein [Pedobacter gandavensis]|uniref:EpsG family protein n=1 Tax=Pedobacter gandavensis TaxID=2679963 RepID=UPI00247AC80A|nr:EpsG family protein [Pedobacter gandavensis]WGQ07516.1 EpsG family protein [Pedobacter gandavensis]
MALLITLLFISLFFLILSGLACNYATKDPISRAFIYWGTSLLFILIAGLREVGSDPDSIGYRNYYESDLILLLAEPTFAFISYIVRNIFGNFQFVLIIYAIIGVLIKYRAIVKLTDLWFLSLVIYFGNYFLLHEFTQIRAGVASGLFLLSIVPLSERRFWKFFSLIVLAILFHYSSIILLPLWFLTNKHLNTLGKCILYLLIPIGIVFHFMNLDLLMAIPIETIKYKLEIYKLTQETASNELNVFNLVYLFKYLTLYTLLYFYETICVKMKYFSILLKIYAIALFSFLALSQNTIFAMRISELLGIVEIILVPAFYYIIKERVFGSVLVGVVAIVYLYINIFYLILAQVF